MLKDKERTEVFLNPENALKYRMLREKYRLKAYRGVENGQDQYAEISTLHDLSGMERLLEKFDFFNRDSTVAHIRKYLGDEWKTLPGDPVPFMSVLALDWIGTVYQGLKHPDFPEIAAVLESEPFQVTPAHIGTYVAKDEVPPDFLATLRDPRTREVFAALKAFYGATKRNIDLAFMAMALKNDPDALSVLHRLRDLGIDMGRSDAFHFLVNTLLPQKQSVRNLLRPGFPTFYHEVTDAFYGGLKTIDAVPELADLYEEAAGGDPRRLALLTSGRFREALSFIRTRFRVADLHPSTLSAVLQITDGFDEKRIASILDRLPEAGANDLIFLGEIARNPGLGKILWDREEMIRSIQRDIYDAKPPAPRTRLDQVNTLIYSPRPDWKKIDALRRGYTERPEPASLPALQLLRIHLLKEALQRPEILQKIGVMVARDLRDDATEHGGTVLLKNGSVEFGPVHSVSRHDGSYANLKYKYFINGIATFHLHAVGTVHPVAFTRIDGIGPEQSHDVWDALKKEGLLNENGKILVDLNAETPESIAKRVPKHAPWAGQILTLLHRIAEGDNSPYSGPSGWYESRGEGDAGYVDAYDLTDVVITTMGRPRDSSGREVKNEIMVNVDLYFIDKRDPRNKRLRVVDLGTYRVPTPQDAS